MADENTEMMAETIYHAAERIAGAITDLADAIRGHSEMLDPHLRELAMSHHELKDKVGYLSTCVDAIAGAMQD